MSTYTQFGYTYAAPASQLLVSQGNASAGSNGCCEGTRALMTDPVTGQTVCSCQYDRLAIGTYSRLGSGLAATSGVYGSTYPSSEQNPYPSIGVDSSAFYPPFGSGYGMKEGGSGDVSMYGTGLGASPAGYYPYDATFAAYGYGPGYDLAARRKNATRIYSDPEGVAERAQEEPLPHKRRKNNAGNYYQDDAYSGVDVVRERSSETEEGK